MQNLIFIVDEEPIEDNSTEEIITTLISNGEEIELEKTVKNSRGFSTGKNKKETEEKEAGILNNHITTLSLAVAARVLPLPFAVLINAAPAAYSLYQFLTKKDDSDISVAELKQSANSFDKYLKRISITPKMAAYKNYHFQPGHPQINLAYIRHPLSEYNEEKRNLYITSDSLDDILLQERESEMIRVFVSLGATKIEFRKENSGKNSITATAKLETRLPTCAGKASVSMDTEAMGIDTDSRVIKLSGREWKQGTKIDRSQFSWLAFEPSWEAIVFAREIGGCLSAELELRKKTVFSSTQEGKAGINVNLLHGSASAEMALNNQEDEVYTVYVEFSKPV
ncbi:hypothetical protein F8538_14740 [Edwardsiella ictaluri]|uniref:hypothetical protein n=1 Tax=Edwardsiella ictaluri TaxID=67780 RepID=UPI0009BE0D80|nr:hypothetical protein [Edwardsiella ictaluri]ARD39470.1 hypothetical protein B6E78_08870 [Edwardsiella ictaluri]QPW27894.1 hypothetical protein F8538_14740 [Edwardsiella ictaluri]